MKEYMHKFKNWYSQLEQRERRAVAVGGVVVSFALLYFVIWSPLADKSNALRERIHKQQMMLSWMRDAEHKINALSGGSLKTDKLTPVELMSVLKKIVDDDGLSESMTQLKQTNNDAITMQFKNVSFDQLMGLLIKVLKKHQVVVSQLHATAVNQPGLVDADVMLRIG